MGRYLPSKGLALRGQPFFYLLFAVKTTAPWKMPCEAITTLMWRRSSVKPEKKCALVIVMGNVRGEDSEDLIEP